MGRSTRLIGILQKKAVQNMQTFPESIEQEPPGKRVLAKKLCYTIKRKGKGGAAG